ncbi:Protein-lysine methyltransferase METTL21C [Dissostichus eleginoides]|uniref:Protein-lysine methyltransferase METTL21C n=1 Tax=Dissostichus eleginoides TaxID=100907 RepID=A0AAD9F7B7_DISEL|nr:Protein-lysine methyltransferase METTL21C [Dissostichus eleginoides]
MGVATGCSVSITSKSEVSGCSLISPEILHWEKEQQQVRSRVTEESDIKEQYKRAWAPCLCIRIDKDVFYFAGQKIIIQGALDSYAGTVWPGALTLCHYFDTHRQQWNLVDKTVLEIGAGTGLLSIVATFLGAAATATDLPEVLGYLLANMMRNTRGRCRHTPQVAALSWAHDLERSWPPSVHHYDYVLAADVVYHHDFLDELLATMKHFCRPGTTLIWANKVRFETDLTFTENFKKAFNTSMLVEDGEMKIFIATCKD